jgi:hypothetical protein
LLFPNSPGFSDFSPRFPEAVSHHAIQRSGVPVEKAYLHTLPVFAIKPFIFSKIGILTMLLG